MTSREFDILEPTCSATITKIYGGGLLEPKHIWAIRR